MAKTRGPNLTGDQKTTVRMMYHDQGETAEDIAEFFGRHRSCICKVLFRKRAPRRKPGRPKKLSEEQVERLVTKKNEFVKKADGLKEVSAKMVKRSARCPASVKTVYRRFKEKGETFRPLTEKIHLDKEDKKNRLVFAKKYAKKPKSYWSKTLDATIDNKWFQIYHNGKHRDWIARRSCRGAYRKRGQAYDERFTKPKAELRYSPGSRIRAGMRAAGFLS